MASLHHQYTIGEEVRMYLGIFYDSLPVTGFRCQGGLEQGPQGPSASPLLLNVFACQ